LYGVGYNHHQIEATRSRSFPMGEENKNPRELAEAVVAARLPPATDQRLQHLMDRNNDGKLSQNEREELESLAAWSEMLSLLRAKALLFLGRKL
jgi:hypothetical protein